MKITVFVPTLTYVYESWVMTDTALSNMETAMIILSEKAHGVILCDKMRRPQQWVSLRPKWRATTHWNRENSAASFSHVPKCPSKDWRGKSYCLQLRKSGLEVQTEWLYLGHCLVPIWCWASRTFWDCCWSWDMSSPSRVAIPITSPEESRALNERMSKHCNIKKSMHFESSDLDKMSLTTVPLPLKVNSNQTCEPVKLYAICSKCRRTDEHCWCQ